LDAFQNVRSAACKFYQGLRVYIDNEVIRIGQLLLINRTAEGDYMKRERSRISDQPRGRRNGVVAEAGRKELAVLFNDCTLMYTNCEFTCERFVLWNREAVLICKRVSHKVK